MPRRVSLCRNAGANRGKIASTVILLDTHTIADLEKIARNKLKIPKRNVVILYEHYRGAHLTDANWKQVVANGTILNVSCGEPFLSPQGMAVSTSSTNPNVPKPPRWPAPFGKRGGDGGSSKPADQTTKETLHSSPPLSTGPATDDAPVVKPNIIFVDLDGVLADFVGAVETLCGRHPSDIRPQKLWQAIQDTDDFFGSLSWTIDGKELFDGIQELFRNDEAGTTTTTSIEILSACPGPLAEQKRRWCANHLGTITVHVCSQTTAKPNWSRARCVLVDDNLDLKDPWEARGGKFVHHQNAQDTLNSLQSIKISNELSASLAGKPVEWPDRCVPYVSLDVIDQTDFSALLLGDHSILPDELQEKIATSSHHSLLSRPHVTLAHMRQISQNDMRAQFRGLIGEQVCVDAVGVLWNDRVAALRVQVADQSESNLDIPGTFNDFVHVTVWICDDKVKPVEANDLPLQVEIGLAKKFHFDQSVRLLTVVSFGNESSPPPKPTPTPTKNETIAPASSSNRSPFACLCGDVMQSFKRIPQTNKYIVLQRHDEHISIDYKDIAAFHLDKGDDLLLQECRGLLLSPTDGTVLARRFHKFFNVNEASGASHIDVSGGLLMEKLDGFLVSPFYSPISRKVRWATRQAHSPEVEALAAASVDCDYNSFVQSWMDQQYTPLFECILRKQHKSIVSYDNDRLVLLAVRHNVDGLYVSWEVAVASANTFNVPVARTIKELGEADTLRSVVDFVQHQMAVTQPIEGVVLVLSDGQRRYKIKTAWYMNHVQLSIMHATAAKKAMNEPQIFRWDGLTSAHWSDLPHIHIWELVLWDRLDESAASDDVLPLHVQRLHDATGCPVNVLLYFVEESRRSLAMLDRELAAWAMDSSVQQNKLQAVQDAKDAGWDDSLIQMYWQESSDESSLKALASFVWQKVIKKSEWDALRDLLHQTFVGLSDLSTDVERLLKRLFTTPEESSVDPPVTIILRGLPNSGKSHFAKHVLVPFFQSLSETTVEIFSADDYFVDPQTGIYHFDESHVALAHEDCRRRFVASTATVQIVDNTNSTLAEYGFYQRHAKKSAAAASQEQQQQQRRVVVIEIRGRGPGHRQRVNDHNVPPWKVDRMKRRWEHDPVAYRIESFRS